MTAGAVEIRRATPADLEPIMAIETAAFVNDAWSPESMAHELADSSCFYLVAVEQAAGEAGAVVAYSGLRAPIGSPDSDIQTITVAPEYRRRGIARDLVRRMLDEAAARGARETFLEVRVDNPGAQTLYESFGFEGIAVRPRYYMPDGVDALVMRASLPAPSAALSTSEDL
ncbi:ribosomal protein S18-alanine N-acetyltransferase [Frondihabitans peucedani]|uniref:N-acetyltransferase domain-containing protein n=1 Tax=Frondihabitans peucedani TaxID=598626 RepID=A0ABP8E2M1_9MICO